jgi:hypothetical protein
MEAFEEPSLFPIESRRLVVQDGKACVRSVKLAATRWDDSDELTDFPFQYPSGTRNATSIGMIFSA